MNLANLGLLSLIGLNFSSINFYNLFILSTIIRIFIISMLSHLKLLNLFFNHEKPINLGDKSLLLSLAKISLSIPLCNISYLISCLYLVCYILYFLPYRSSYILCIVCLMSSITFAFFFCNISFILPFIIYLLYYISHFFSSLCFMSYAWYY